MTDNLLDRFETIINLVQITIPEKSFLHEVVQLGTKEEPVTTDLLVFLSDSRIT